MATEIVIPDDQPSAAAAALGVLWGEGINPVGFRVSPWTRGRSNWIRSRLTAGRPLKQRPTGVTVSRAKTGFPDSRRWLARKVAERINQLGGTPNFNPNRLATRSWQHVEASNLGEMIEETPMCRPNIPAAGPMSPRNRLPSLY